MMIINKLKLLKTGAVTLLLVTVLANPAIGSLQDDLNNENLSMVAVFERALQDGLELNDIITEAIQTHPTSSTTALAAAIVVAPESIPEIVSTAAKIETKPETVGAQCQTVLTSEMVGHIIVSSIDNGFQAEVIMRMCLPALRQEEVASVVVSALIVANESLHANIISAAFDAISDGDTNNVTLLAGDLVQSLAEQNFQSPITEADIMELSEITSTAAPSSNIEAPVPLPVDPEPPASDS